jgi:predicted CXXCH cytochrome family protein
MPSSFRDPKTLADWIQLDYVRKPGRFWRIRNLLTGLIFVLCTAMMAFTWWPRTHFIYESRPVSSAHAMFNDHCSVCHLETFQPATRLLRGDPNVRSVQDETCRSCHGVGQHQECVQEPNCSTCHQEHRGRPVLARVADTHCTVCHAKLDAVCPSRKKSLAANIREFIASHPPFGGGQLEDRGTIRFNHKVHLSLKPESVRGIDKPLAALREQECNYCHQPDAAGRYLKPINYEQHCSQCHALSVGVAGTLADEKVRPAAARFAQEPAPHKDPLMVRATLRERYTRFVQENPSILGAQESAEPPRWIPGGIRAQPVLDKEWLWVNEQLQTAERMVFDGANGCGYCHTVDVAGGPANLPQYAPSRIRQVWFEHSIFSHERHRMLRCAECHDAAASRDTKDVLLPGIELCRKCHNPQVGARTECAECHRYHDRVKEKFRGQKSISESTQKQ